MGVQMSIFDLDLSFGKMSQELSQATEARTFGVSWKNFVESKKTTFQFLCLTGDVGRIAEQSSATASLLRGDLWTLNTSEYLNVESVSPSWLTTGGANAADILLSGEPFVGDITDGRFGKVLPVGEGLRGNYTQSRQEGQGVTRCAENGIGESDNSYTLKIRGGSDTYTKPDGSIGTAGKGALIQTEQSATLGVSQDQTLFAPNRSVGVDTYNQNITGDVAATLNATSCDSPSHSGLSVLAYGLGRDSFNSGTNAQFTMSIEEETQPPITERGAGGVCSITQ